MASSSSAPPPTTTTTAATAKEVVHAPKNLAIAMFFTRNCDVDFVRKYVGQHGKNLMTTDERDKNGRTPLMIACLHGNKDAVEYLLELGGGVNAECAQLKNTPLHYTCKWEDNGDAYGSSFWRHDLKASMPEKVAIAKILLDHGAVYKANSIGLTPICYAGLHQMRPLVDLLGEELESKVTADASLTKEKVKGLELMGTAYVLDRYSISYTLAHSCMLEAKQLYLTCLHSAPSGETSCEVEKLFKRKECNTVEELESLGKDEDAIQVEGFLLGARVIPDELKPQYYWDALLELAETGVDFAQTCSIVSLLLRVGNATKLTLYDIFVTLLDDSIWMSDSYVTKYFRFR